MKKIVAVFMGYYYFSIPLADALSRLYPDYKIKLINPKDMVGSTTNSEAMEKIKLVDYLFEYCEFPGHPPWYQSNFQPTENVLLKIFRLLRHYLYFFSYKRRLKKFITHVDFDEAVFVSDQSYSYALVHEELSLRTTLLQPCYLDLWDRNDNVKWLRKILSRFNRGFYPSTHRFGFSFLQGNVGLWEADSCEIYDRENRPYYKIKYPLFEYLRLRADVLRSNNGKIRVSVLPANYELNHGKKYQSDLESQYRNLVRALVDLNCQVSLKIHPNESVDYWSSVFGPSLINSQLVKFLMPNTDRLGLFFDSTYVISTNSFSAVEASLCGAFVINFNPLYPALGEEFSARFERYCHVPARDINSVISVISEGQHEIPDNRRELEFEIMGGVDSLSYCDLMEAVE